MIVGGNMEEFVKLEFDVLSYENFVDLISWSVFADKGALPLKDVTYDYYPQLREIEDYLEEHKDDRRKVSKAIHDELEKTYRKYLSYSKTMVKRYEKIWEQYEKQYITALSEYFDMEWPEGFENITAYVGRIPVCPRFINEKMFFLDFMDADKLVDTCMHEILHFMFFLKCSKLFPNQRIEYDNNSLFWYMSEIVIDPILNNVKFKNIFKHKFRSYDSFYNVKFSKELLMDKVHLIFSTNKIDDAIVECYSYLKKNEYELRKQTGDSDKDEVLEVRMD